MTTEAEKLKSGQRWMIPGMQVRTLRRHKGGKWTVNSRTTESKLFSETELRAFLDKACARKVSDA